MSKYSFPFNQRKRKIDRVVGKIQTYHLKRQNTAFLIISFVFTYFLVKTGMITAVVNFLGNFGYLSALILGFLFSFGFTTTPASATLFFLAKHINPFTMAFVAGMGAAISNVMIYNFVKYKLLDEIKFILAQDLKFEFSKFEIILNQQMMKSKWFRLFVPTFAGILTALPVSTEMLTSILWSIGKYSTKTVFFYSFIFSFLGILFIGILGRV